MISDSINNLPSTRYRGSKRKLAGWLKIYFDELKFDSVLDGFGGTGTVSYILKQMRKKVTYNDYMKFNYYIGKSLIENQKFILSKSDLKFLLDHNFENATHTLIQNKFRNIYYKPNENKWIDNLINRIENIHTIYDSKNKAEIGFKKYLSYNALFQSCLVKRPFNLFHRKNLNLRISNVVRNFGNKKTWDKSFKDHFNNFVTEINGFVFDSGIECKSMNKNIFDINENDFDLVYLDPPYFSLEGSNESSDYFKCYHFLEGISKYKEWESLIHFETPNLRFKSEYLPFQMNEKTIKENFEKLLYKFRKSSIVISYKKGGIPSIEFMKRTLEKLNKKVKTVSKHYSYALNHQNGNAKFNREVLIIGKN